MRAVVTGANGGLGTAVVERLVRDGADVVVVDASPAVGQLAERLKSVRGGVKVEAVVGDVAQEDLSERAVAVALSTLGGVELLVNVAGIGGPTSEVVDTGFEEFRRTLDVNLVGTFLMSRAAARAMVGQRRGNIVNIGSLFGQQGVARGAAYCASKGGVTLLTQTLALELAPHGIRVNGVAPGNMATEMHWDELRARAKVAGSAFEDEVEAVRRLVPLGRHGTGADVAAAVAWLASDDSAYVTGQMIGVNGGVHFSW